MDPVSQHWRCGQHGIFLPASAVVAHPTAVKRLVTASRAGPGAHCAACDSTMQLVHLKEASVDLCDCGALWLDDGEQKALKSSRVSVEGAWLTLESLFWLGWLFG